jgi:hypothetical protein
MQNKFVYNSGIRIARQSLTAYRLRALFSEDTRRRLVNRRSDIVIDGYPRSGNTFFKIYVELSNPTLRIAHHIHSPAQITGAARYSVPTLILFRDPREACLSSVIRSPRLTVRNAARDYVEFYSHAIKHETTVAFLGFKHVTQEPSDTLFAAASRFNTTWNCPHVDEELSKSIFTLIDERNLQFGGGLATSISRPNAEKDAAKVALIEEWDSLGTLTSETEELYELMLRKALK